mmetsp:Transcript_7739/g.27204  ORF Transcript_7739/g.27204 Transcript_7739/m.27204 type:complete len:380 (+) Transcript_7739:493-1632(+)
MRALRSARSDSALYSTAYSTVADLTLSRALRLYLNSDMLSSSPMFLANSLKPPGCSGMVVTITASVLSPTSASSETSLRRSKFMFAPEVIATTRDPAHPCVRRKDLHPARATAPAGSSMDLVSSKTSFMAAHTSSVSTRTTPSSSCWHTRNVSVPTVLTATPSAKESTLVRLVTPPRYRLCAMPFAPAGSTPITLTSGRTLLTNAATPAASPPPPMGTNTASSLPAHCRSISIATVPCPAITAGSSKGWMRVRPSSRARLSAYACVSSNASPTSATSPPSASTAFTLIPGVVTGMHTTALVPSLAAARDTPWAWLPAEEQITPALSWDSVSWAMQLYAPRSLKLNTGCSSSRLSRIWLPMPTRADSRGAGTSGDSTATS